MVASEAGAFALIPKLISVLKAQRFPNGDRAALKRMALDGPAPMAFHRFVVDQIEPGRQEQPEWRTIICALALQRDGGFDPRVPFGKALAEARFSEGRLERLLSARGGVLDALALRAARHLSARGMPCDWRQFAELVFSPNDDIRTRIARDFYRNVPKE
jgi:CRISPR system Cascade subunit CasB